jgi:penicillin-binding protein 2
MFVGYAPFDNPEIVVYVLIEFGGFGGEAAAPLAGDMFEFYFKTLRGK